MNQQINPVFNLDALVTESEMHLITSKLDQNINQNLDQQIITMIKNESSIIVCFERCMYKIT